MTTLPTVCSHRTNHGGDHESRFTGKGIFLHARPVGGSSGDRCADREAVDTVYDDDGETVRIEGLKN